MREPARTTGEDSLVEPRVSIVVCTRDRPQLLVEALAALGRAASPNTEIIVVDSASVTADTENVARAAGVRYFRSNIPGLSIARNAGLAAARAPIVVYTDDDCSVDEQFLEPLVAPFLDPAVGASTGTLRDVGAQHPVTLGAPVTLRRPVDGIDAGHGALMAFRHSTLHAAGGFDPLLGAGRRFGGAEDLDAVCRVLLAGFDVVQVPAAVVTHVYTRDDEDYVTLNLAYGRGLGAMCTKWFAISPRWALALTARVVRRALTRLVRRARHARTRHGQQAFIRGLVQGWRESRRIPVANSVLVDQHPPAPVVIDDRAGQTTEDLT